MQAEENNRGYTKHQPGASQLEIAGLEAPKTQVTSLQTRRGRYRSFKRPPTNPDLFPNGRTERMASNRLIWEGGNILTQGRNLNWADSGKGSLYYESPVEKGKGYVIFWLTNDLHGPNPAVLEGEAALALIEQFDIRAACLHLIYAALATQLERPWEQSFVVSDTQLERYLGLDKNHKLNKQQKLELMLDLAKQPCHLLVYVSWQELGAVGSFSVSRTWLWEIAEPILHFQDCLHEQQGLPIGEQKLVGFTLRVRCGNWAQYFLNEEKRQKKSGYYEYSILSQALLHDLMSVWHHHEGAARLMTWLLFKIKVNRNSPLTVEMLMKVAFGAELVLAAKVSSKERKRLVRLWETALKVLLEKGWGLKPDPETYPPQYWPDLHDSEPLAQIPDDPEEAVSFWALDAASGEGARLTDITKRTRGSFERLLSGKLWVWPKADIAEKLDEIEQRRKPDKKKTQHQVVSKSRKAEGTTALTGETVRELRTARGLSVTRFAELVGLAKSTVSMIETGKRPITPEIQTRFKKALGISS